MENCISGLMLRWSATDTEPYIHSTMNQRCLRIRLDNDDLLYLHSADYNVVSWLTEMATKGLAKQEQLESTDLC